RNVTGVQTCALPILLAAAAALVPFSGVDRHTLLVLGLPFLLMGGSTLLVNLLYGDQGVEGALGAAVRVLAIALPGLLAAVSSDSSEERRVGTGREDG